MNELQQQFQSAFSFSIDELSSLDITNLTKLTLSQSDKVKVASVFRQFLNDIPGDGQKYYTVTFPEGLPNTLSTMKHGGLSTTIRDPNSGKILGQASLNDVTTAVQMANVISLMAAATNQYYLEEIDEKLEIISQKIDRILEFLYGDKKAELLSEISFSRYAYENYSSICKHDEQVIATINSLHDGKKVAIKDIEFYIADVNSIASTDYKSGAELEKNAERALQICKSIDMSIQLYTMNCLLEVYYSGNTDPAYITYLEDDIAAYVEKCDKRILQDLSKLEAKMENSGKSAIKLPGKNHSYGRYLKEMRSIMNELQNQKIGEKQKELIAALDATVRAPKYVLSDSGDVYIETSAD